MAKRLLDGLALIGRARHDPTAAPCAVRRTPRGQTGNRLDVSDPSSRRNEAVTPLHELLNRAVRRPGHLVATVSTFQNLRWTTSTMNAPTNAAATTANQLPGCAIPCIDRANPPMTPPAPPSAVSVTGPYPPRFMTKPVSQPVSSPTMAVIAIVSKFMTSPPRQATHTASTFNLEDAVGLRYWTLVLPSGAAARSSSETELPPSYLGRLLLKTDEDHAQPLTT